MAKSTANPKYTRIGGWLLFFVIVNVLAVLSSIETHITSIGKTGLFALLKDMGPLRATERMSVVLLSLALLLSFATTVLAIIWIFQLCTGRPKFLRIYQITQIINCMALLLAVIVPSIINGYPELRSIWYLVGGVAGFFIMTYYYSKSVRVRTYMGSDEYKRLALFRYHTA